MEHIFDLPEALNSLPDDVLLEQFYNNPKHGTANYYVAFGSRMERFKDLMFAEMVAERNMNIPFRTFKPCWYIAIAVFDRCTDAALIEEMVAHIKHHWSDGDFEFLMEYLNGLPHIKPYFDPYQTATPQQVIETGLAVVKDIYQKAWNPNTIEVKKANVSLSAEKGKSYYSQDGWYFSVDSQELYGNTAMVYIIYFLRNGTPVHTASVLGDDNPLTIYIIWEGNTYKGSVHEETFLKHHNLDFKGFIKKQY